MNSFEEYKPTVGDEVTVFYRGKPNAILHVERITKRFVELRASNGQLSKWQPALQGRYPRQDWDHNHAIPTTEAHRANINHTRLVHALSNVNWVELPLGTLQQIWLLVRPSHK